MLLDRAESLGWLYRGKTDGNLRQDFHTLPRTSGAAGGVQDRVADAVAIDPVAVRTTCCVSRYLAQAEAVGGC